MKKIIGSIARASIGILLASVLIYNVIKQSGVDLKAEFYGSDSLLLSSAFILYGVALIFTIWRWQLLLDVQGIRLPFSKITALSMIGIFFNLVIPGAVSGDLIKMLYIAPQAKGRTTEAVLTIFLDRVLGLLGLFLVGLVSIVISLKFLMSAEPVIQLGALTVGVGCICLMLGWGLMEYRKHFQRVPIVANLINRIERFVPEKIKEAVTRFILALDIYGDSRQVVVKAIILSMLVHVCLSLTVFCVGRGFHETKLSANRYFLSTQVANAVGAIPITPSGIGSRDVAFKLFLEGGGADAHKAAIIPIFYSFVLASWSLIGGLFFIFIKRK